MLPTIRILRMIAGIKQQTLAKTLGCSGAYLSNIESGKRRLNERMKKKISEALGVTENYFD